jgi:4-amino-4-deoxy-L-arabinose transferase-like glycosyltransferase
MTRTASLRKAYFSGSTHFSGRLLFFAVLAALAVRLVVVALVYSSFLVPEREHWLFGFEVGKVASSIAAGHGFGNPYYGPETGPTALVPPVLPYLLAGIFALFGVYTKAAAVAILSVESLFSALTCIPTFFVARKSFGNQAARWAVWVWAFFPYAIYFSAGMIRDSALLTLLVSCIFWAALCLEDTARVWAWAGFGLLCGLGALTNPNVLSVAPLLGAWAYYRLHKQGRQGMVAAGGAVLICCAAISPWLVRNYETFHKPVFLRDGFALELCVGNTGNALHWWNGSVQPSGSAQELEEFDRLGELGYMNAKKVEAVDFIKNHPGTFLWRLVRRFIYLWTGYWSFNREYLREEPFDPANIFLCTTTTVLALIGLRKMLARDVRKVVPFGILLLFFPLVYYVTHPDIQYRHPVDPELIIFACCAIVSWRSGSQNGFAEEPR